MSRDFEIMLAHTMTLRNGAGLIGILLWGDGKLVFVGKDQKAAKEMCGYLKQYVDAYIKAELK